MNRCSLDECENLAITRGYCSAHYQKLRRKGIITNIQPVKVSGSCLVEGCEKPVRAKQLCATHYNHFRRTGKIVRDPYTYELDCLVDECTNKRRSNGFCTKHYARYRRTGQAEGAVRETLEFCKIPKCEVKTHARDFCERHYGRWRRGTLTEDILRNGDPINKPIAHMIEDLEELLSFGVQNIEELWSRAGFNNEQHMMYYISDHLKERVKNAWL